MWRKASLLLWLGLLRCGARTALGIEGAAEEDGGIDLVDAGGNAETGVRSDSCPLTPSLGPCANPTMQLQCFYELPSATRISSICCTPAGWVECPNDAAVFAGCTTVECMPGTHDECITDPDGPGGSSCCTCGADMALDQCGPC